MTINFNKNLLINPLLIFLIFVIDRISKIYVINLDKKFFGSEIFASKYLNISLIWNEGIAFKRSFISLGFSLIYFKGII